MIGAHADVVGSLLRPTELLEAREALAAGRIAPAAFKAIEDRAVDDAVAIQEDAGLEIVTDGELRRLSFQSQLPEAVAGFGEYDLDAFLWGAWHGDSAAGDVTRRRPPNLGVVHKLERKRHLCTEEFTYLRSRTRRVPKVTLPSPSLWANFWSPKRSLGAYPSLDAYLADVVDILRDEVTELVRLGAAYIQLDAPHYTAMLDPSTSAYYESLGWSGDTWLSRGIEMDNAVIGAHPDVTFAFHLCRGNQDSRWLVEGGYESLAATIFKGIHAHRLMLEYDDSRSGSFEPLRQVPEDKWVVLGLVTTKSGRRETVAELSDRVREASRYFPLDRLAISPQCGFATSILGNRLSAEEQSRKLRVVVETAEAVWG